MKIDSFMKYCILLSFYWILCYGTKLDNKTKINVKTKVEEAMYKSFILSKLFENNKNVSTSDNDPCIDPSPDQYSNDLLEMIYMFKDTLGILDLNAVKSVYGSIILNKTKAVEITLNADVKPSCNRSVSRYKLKDFILCPSYQVLKIRDNMIPNLIIETKCSCDKCLEFSNSKADIDYSCLPVKINSPALIKDKCENGVFKYRPILERVSVGCICSQTRPRIQTNN